MLIVQVVPIERAYNTISITFTLVKKKKSQPPKNPSGHGLPSLHLVLNCTCGYGRIEKIPYFGILDRKSMTPVGHNGLLVTLDPVSSSA